MSSCDRVSVLCKEAFEKFPFGVIMSKSAPNDLDNINPGTDFCYKYFSPGLEARSEYKREDMLTGAVNAKTKFAPDWDRILADDKRVMADYTDNKVMRFCEHWAAPGQPAGSIPFVYAMKTALSFEQPLDLAHDESLLVRRESYMLCCFELIDDLMLGACSEKVVPHDALKEAPSMGPLHIADNWFREAFHAWPYGLAIYNPSTKAIEVANHHYDARMPTNEADVQRLLQDSEGVDLLTTAKWTTSADGELNVGIYGIQVDNVTYHVIVLRCAMKRFADPLFVDGEIVKRA